MTNAELLAELLSAIPAIVRAVVREELAAVLPKRKRAKAIPKQFEFNVFRATIAELARDGSFHSGDAAGVRAVAEAMAPILKNPNDPEELTRQLGRVYSRLAKKKAVIDGWRVTKGGTDRDGAVWVPERCDEASTKVTTPHHARKAAVRLEACR